MRLGLVAPLGEATIASSLTTLRTSDGDVVDGHIAVKRNGVVGRRGRVDALPSRGIARRDNRCGTVANEGPGNGANSGDSDSHSRKEVDTRTDHDDSRVVMGRVEDVLVCCGKVGDL